MLDAPAISQMMKNVARGRTQTNLSLALSAGRNTGWIDLLERVESNQEQIRL